jgi:hypothetical protein
MAECYLMVKDVEGQDALEFGADFGLAEGEILPEDVEELTEAQYTVYKFLTVLRGTFDEDAKAAIEEQATDKPSGLIVPN